MTELRPDEQVAKATIGAVLGLVVEQHDDGSQPSMYDLKVLAGDSITAAVEVTAAIDAESHQLWKLVNGSDERWIVEDLRGGWALTLRPTARARRLLKELPSFLRELEALGVEDIYVPQWREESLGHVEGRARELGIVEGNQGGTDFPGSIYLTVELPSERSGGMVDSSGASVPAWVREFLTAPAQSDVLHKLQRSGAEERHAFIIVPSFSLAPFGVIDMLWREMGDVVPVAAPTLPEEVTHVWLMSWWTVGSGLRWSPGEGWVRFERVFT